MMKAKVLLLAILHGTILFYPAVPGHGAGPPATEGDPSLAAAVDGSGDVTAPDPRRQGRRARPARGTRPASSPNSETTSLSRAPEGTGGIEGNVTAFVWPIGFVPLPNIPIDVYDADGEHIGNTFTDASGNYSFGGLGTYDYIVRFYTRHRGYYNTYYSNAQSVLDATLVHVTDGAFTTHISTLPEVGGAVGGTVTDGADPIANVTVALYDREMNSIADETTDAAGEYRLTGLNTGAYTLEFSAQDQGFIPEFHSNKTSQLDADPVTVAILEETWVNAVLARGGSIAGQVTDTGGAPIAGATASAYDKRGDKRVSDTADGDGRYLIGGLPTGSYAVEFKADGFLGEYNGDGTWGCLDRIAVRAPNVTAGVNASLIEGGRISGTVSDGVAALADVKVKAYPAGYFISTSATTDALGRYEIGGLKAGNYIVFFDGDNVDLASEYYSNRPRRSLADHLTVSAPGHVSGIDAVLSPGGTIAGTVTDAAGAAVRQAYVEAVDANGFSKAGHGYSDAAGDYDITNIPPGSYHVKASAGRAGMLSEYYDNSRDRVGATSVTVTGAGVVTGIDFALARGGVLSGRVTAGGQPVDGLSVSAEAVEGSRGGDSTNILGRYWITGLPTGRYRVNFYGPDFGYRDEHYNNRPLFAESALVDVTAPRETSGIDAVMDPHNAGTMSGDLTWPDGICGGERTWVDIYGKKPADEYDIPGWGMVGPFGTYYSSDLPPGRYDPYFGWSHDNDYAGFWHGTTQSCHLFAKPVEISAGENTPGVDADFDRHQRLMGKYPVPWLYANGAFRTLEVTTGDEVTLELELDCVAAEGVEVDQWLLGLPPLPPPHQVYSFVPPRGWRQGLFPGRQGRCRSFDEITLDVKRLPPGRTSILFGLDPLGGGLDLSRVVTGCVDVIVR